MRVIARSNRGSCGPESAGRIRPPVAVIRLPVALVRQRGGQVRMLPGRGDLDQVPGQ